jgi:hypothetical protein
MIPVCDVAITEEDITAGVEALRAGEMTTSAGTGL